MLPLKNIKVLDLSRVLAGPYCSMLLADLGAEVVKIEVPERGDDSRSFGPFINNESAYFMSINRNKKSITLNLKHPKGKEIFKKLVKHFDVILENFRPGTMEKLGLGYEVIKEINPKIIYAAISGFGHTGPYKEKPAYDAVIQAMGGLMSITGFPDGKPVKVGTSIADITTGMFGAIGILVALIKRQMTGEGDKVDVAMLDSIVSILENAVARYFVTQEVPKPIGNRHPSIAPFESFSAANGEFIIAVGNDELWEKFCKTVGREKLINDIKFSTNKDRVKNHSELKQILENIFKNNTVEYWIELLEKAGIPCSPINSIDKVVVHPQVLSREMIVKINHKLAGEVFIPGNPIKFGSFKSNYNPAPVLSEHTEDILKNMLNMTDKDLDELRNEGII